MPNYFARTLWHEESGTDDKTIFLVINNFHFKYYRANITSPDQKSQHNGGLSCSVKLVFPLYAKTQLNITMLSHQVHRRIVTELYKDFTRQLRTWRINMSARKNALEQPQFLWNFSAPWRAPKGWARQKGKLQLASLVFRWKGCALIRMAFKRQVCISCWSVTSCGEVYVPNERI